MSERQNEPKEVELEITGTFTIQQMEMDRLRQIELAARDYREAMGPEDSYIGESDIVKRKRQELDRLLGIGAFAEAEPR